jgi:hypothetical protein
VISIRDTQKCFGTLPERDDKSKTFHKNFDKFIEARSFATLDMMPGPLHSFVLWNNCMKNMVFQQRFFPLRHSAKRHDAIKPQKKNGYKNIMLHSSKTLFQVKV